MIAPRADSMTAFSNSLDLDDVQTPARYFALLFSLSTGVLGLLLNSNRHVELSIMYIFISSLSTAASALKRPVLLFHHRKFYPRITGLESDPGNMVISG